jgi:hypothetical protein
MTTGRIPSVEGGIQPTIIDAAGDLIYGASNDTPAILAIGTAGQVLQVNSGATAPEWVTPAGGGSNWSLLNAGGTALTGASTITVSGISGKDKIMFVITGASSVNASSTFTVRLNGDSSSNYTNNGGKAEAPAAYSIGVLTELGITDTSIKLGKMASDAGSKLSGYVLLSGCNSSGVKVYNSVGAGRAAGAASAQEAYYLGGIYDSATVISSISILSSSGNFDAGNVYVYTSA